MNCKFCMTGKQGFTANLTANQILTLEKGYDTVNLYFDDEELDRFKGMKPEEYSDADIEEFRQVLYTMREDEVENWAHCMETRGIELPVQIREEILLMLQ